MPLPYLHYDVFTSQPLVGNQLAVFGDARALDAGQMQAIAREMNFAESTFILPADRPGTNARMRIFTPAEEMPMAGHPTIGSTFALAEMGVIAPGTKRFVFGLNVGPTPVDLEWDANRLRFAWMTQGHPQFGPAVSARGAVAVALGLAAADLADDLPVQEVSCGTPFLLVPLCDTQAVDRAISDAAALRRLKAEHGIDRPIFLFAVDRRVQKDPDGRVQKDPPYTATVGRVLSDPACAVYSRMFAPSFGIMEDSATGSASGPLGCYLLQHRVITSDAARRIVSTQGVAMGRTSRIHIAIDGEPDAITRVQVGGEAVLVGRGELLL